MLFDYRASRGEIVCGVSFIDNENVVDVVLEDGIHLECNDVISVQSDESSYLIYKNDELVKMLDRQATE